MAETAAHLVDHVLPPVPVRQWVLTLPFALRYLVAFDADLLADVRRRFVRAVFRFQRAQARRRGINPAEPGAVVFVQRFGSAINLAPHLHGLFLDGVYDDRGLFHRLPAPTDDEVADVIARVVRQVTKALRRRGHPLGDPDDAVAGDAPLPFDSPTLGACYGASVQRRVAFGPPSGARRLGRQPDAPFVAFSGPRCAALEGFTLHANTRVAGRDRDALERLGRYLGRPSVATERLRYEPGGRVTYRLRKPWNDGTHTLDFDPLAFLERLAALVPPPRANLVTYHGVFAPNHTLRDTVVRQAGAPPYPFPHYRRRPRGERGHVDPTDRPDRYTWAQLLARVFLIDALQCPRCHGRRQIIALITDPPVITAILECLHLFPRQVVTDPPHAPP